MTGVRTPPHSSAHFSTTHASQKREMVGDDVPAMKEKLTFAPLIEGPAGRAVSTLNGAAMTPQKERK